MKFSTLFGNLFNTVYGDELTHLPTDFAMPVAKYADDEQAMSQVITATGFLPRVQLFGGNSNACKEGKINVGRYGLTISKDEIIDLTAQFDCYPFCYRFCGVRLVDGNVHSYYNPRSPDFAAIMKDADTIKDSGCFYGLEFLIWVPTVSKFATFFFNSKTARRQAPNMRTLAEERKAATMKTEYIKTKKYSWHGPIVVACSTPFPLPPLEDIKEQATRFANPKESVIEKVTGMEDVPSGDEARPQ